MSVNESMVLLRDVREFSIGAAEFIALEVAMGASVAELHEHHEDMVPSPIVVNRWRKKVPAFDLLMREAEEAKAQTLAEEVIGIAKDEQRQAAISGNMIKARQWLAGQLSESFRNGKTGGGGGVHIEKGVVLTDEQLMQIAAGKFNGNVVEGEVVAPESLPAPDVEAVVVEDERAGGPAVGNGEGEEPLVEEGSAETYVEPGNVGEDEQRVEETSGGWDFL